MTGFEYCSACGSSDIEMYDFPFPLFRHLDFTRIGTAGGRLGECGACGTIFRIVPPEILAGIDDLYRTEQYAAHDEVHAILMPGAAEPVPVSRVQAEALVGLLPASPPRILDFGCFNGRLLREFSSLRPDATLAGYDVADRAGFPTSEAFTFVSGDWRNIDGPFDLVCLSHSIQYVPDVAELLVRIREWIAPEGVVFIQTPDIAKKFCTLLLGDVHYYFSTHSLTALMTGLGFHVTAMRDLPFPRDVVVLGRIGTAATPPNEPSVSGAVLEDAVRHVRSLAAAVALQRGCAIDGILGTTIEAGFVDELLSGTPRFFVDENPEKIGQTFRGRPIVPPLEVPRGARVLVPLGEQSARVATRLSQTLPAEFVPI